ncbi:Calcineurin-like phosphoesterase [Corynebacterium capitovis DSM 44611]|uniref:metallophosphoesterase family protein n=1 Tax=Corynebacterium capitovis TaxID=131081 RepID=UPI00035F9C39|nr:metallophosphoesterase [Corynebacterium capitovis]WKD57479.1 Calcineurin-like phosphoesterase [Corynebacterium capitovis DSM 44611]
MSVTLWAVSDLHAAVGANGPRIAGLAPENPGDWLIVAGDVAENMGLVARTLGSLAERFDTVIWTPGNHELFSRSTDRYRGRERYAKLVDVIRGLGVMTPEDPYPLFGGVTIAPLFTLYDYSFRPAGVTVEEALEGARERNVVLTDEFAIAPFADIRAWCWERLAYTTKRLSRIHGPTVLVNHWPLERKPTTRLRLSDISLWSGTRHTHGWATRYNARRVVYGHLHMPGTTMIDGVAHVDVSLGYPREWQSRAGTQPWPYPVMEWGGR